MKHDKIAKFASLITVIYLAAGCAATPKIMHEKHTVRLLVRLPASCNTPDGATLDAAGNIILSIPNFNNGALLKDGVIESPASPKMVKIDMNNELNMWYEFRKEDMHPDTGKIGPRPR